MQKILQEDKNPLMDCAIGIDIGDLVNKIFIGGGISGQRFLNLLCIVLNNGLDLQS